MIVPFKSWDEVMDFVDNLPVQHQAQIALRIKNTLNVHLTTQQLAQYGVGYPRRDPDETI